MNVGKWMIGAAFVGLVMLLMPAAAKASMVSVGNSIKLDANEPGKQGTFGLDNQTTGNSFLVFCLERHESFSPSATYTVTNLSTRSSETGRELSGYSAWVYNEFLATVGAATTLSGNHPLGMSWDDAANTFQMAIWAGMVDAPNGSITKNHVGTSLDTDAGNTKTGAELQDGQTQSGFPTFDLDWLTDATDDDSSLFDELDLTFADFEADTAWHTAVGWNGANIDDLYNLTGTYRVMTIVDSVTGKRAQDQIVNIGDPPPIKTFGEIPEPGSLAILFGLMCCAGGYRHVRRKLA